MCALNTMSLAFALEKELAVSAVLRACQLTSSIFNKLVKDERLTKGDKSPVTGSRISPSHSHEIVISQHLLVVMDFYSLNSTHRV